jgi:hypothetical protein
MTTLTRDDLYMIMLALNITSNIPVNYSDFLARQSQQMKELYNRLDDLMHDTDYQRPFVFTVKQQ